jgi:outer membrane protein assembly factor BamE
MKRHHIQFAFILYRPQTMRTYSSFAGLFVVALSWVGLSACSTVERPMEKAAEAMTRYRAEVLQGNVITKEQVDALKPGMLQVQVRDILGTPLVQSVFHQDRWDYAYTIRRDGKTAEQRHLSVFFKEGRLDRTEGDQMPSETEFTNAVAQSLKKEVNKKAPQAVLVATPEQLKKAESKAASTPVTGLVKAAPRTYPTLDAPANWKEPATP